MAIPTDVLEKDRGLGEWSVMTAYRGSIAHGTYVRNTEPNSIDDKDVMAFCVPSLDYYTGLRDYGSRGTVEVVHGEWDVVIYEARKALRLLEKGNPNVLSMLWLPDNLVISTTDAGRYLVANRDTFVGRHVYQPYMGYATAQLRKMQSGEYKGYMGDKRRALVEKFGYDTKNASHLIRLLRQGIEFLRDGELNVVREDASELVAIKNGEWPLEKVKTEAEHLFKRAEGVYDRSTLPLRPDHDAVSDLCMEVVRLAHVGRGQGA